MNTEQKSNKVEITGIRKAVNKETGEEFNSLVLEQAAVKVSKATGRPYMTTIKGSITCTFSEAQAKKLVGSSLPGRLVVVELSEDQHRDWVNSKGETIRVTTGTEYQPA